MSGLERLDNDSICSLSRQRRMFKFSMTHCGQELFTELVVPEEKRVLMSELERLGDDSICSMLRQYFTFVTELLWGV